MEERSKEDILSELYAIRATMSLISQKTDVSQKEEYRVWEAKQKIEKSKSDIETHKRNGLALAEKSYGISTRLREIANEERPLREEISKKEEAFEEAKAKIAQRRVEDRKQYEAKAQFVICFIGLLILLSPLMIFVTSWFPWAEGYYYVPFICGPAAAFILAGLGTAAFSATRTHLKRSSDKSWDEQYERQVAQPMRELQPKKDRLNQLMLERKKLEALREKGETYFDNEAVAKIQKEQRRFESRVQATRADREEIAARESKIVQIAKESQKIIESAKNLYPVIDFRDWANVDLIIFYYETGRADTMKEALQQVDRQRQNDTLVRAIGMATEILGKTITQSVRSLGETLGNSFRRLSVQLEWQHQRSMEEVDGLKTALEEQGEALHAMREQAEEIRLSAEAQARMQATNQAMTNALLEKINVSSMQLANDMDKQMKLVHHIYV